MYPYLCPTPQMAPGISGVGLIRSDERTNPTGTCSNNDEHVAKKTFFLRLLVYLVIYDSGKVSLPASSALMVPLPASFTGVGRTYSDERAHPTGTCSDKDERVAK